MKNTLSPVRRLLNLRPGSDAAIARSFYDMSVDQANAAWARLDHRGSLHPDSRARLLTTLGSAELRMADSYRDGYGLGWPDTDGIVRMYEDTSELLHLLASTSVASNPWSRVKARGDWEEAFGTILDELTLANTNATLYAELLTRLWFPVAQHLGAEAAETVNHLIASIFRASDNAAALADSAPTTT